MEESMSPIPFTRATALGIVALVGAIACGDDTPAPRAAANRPAANAAPGPAASEGARNAAPIIERVEIVPAEPTAYDTLQAQVELRDPDGDRATTELTWWVNGRRAGDSDRFSLEGTRRGAKIEVSVVADDGRAQSEPATASVTLGNTPPRIDTIRFEPSGAWQRDRTMAALPDAVDPDGDPLTFEYTWVVNERRLDATGPTIEGGTLTRGDRVRLVVVASDGYAESEALETDEMMVENAAPEITSTPGAIGPDGFFRYQLEVDDADGDRAFSYRLVEGPPGMELDTLGGKLVWQPREAHAGSHAIELEVDDRMGGVDTQRFTLDVHFDAPPASTP
jgi:hypothetical protein